MKSIVIAFGRFNPPTTGHGLLINIVRKEAQRLRADALIFPSQSCDPRKNPLPFREKVTFMRQLWGDVMHFSDSTAIRTPFDALVALSAMGYDAVYVVVGSDRAPEFRNFARYIKPRTADPKFIKLAHYEVLVAGGDRNPDSDDVSGMSASKMRAAAARGDFTTFRSGVPTQNVTLAKQLYKSVRRHMGIQESRKLAVLFYSVRGLPVGLPRLVEAAGMQMFGADRVLREGRTFARLMERAKPVFVDVSSLSFSDARRTRLVFEAAGYTTRMLVHMTHSAGIITEDRLARLSVAGMLMKEPCRRVVVESQSAGNVKRAVGRYVRELMEAEWGEKPKQPSEVDRLKDKQKQDMLLTKQRQAQELFQAQQRELQKKARESQNKIAAGDKPASITR
jgi:hypothetical protein